MPTLSPLGTDEIEDTLERAAASAADRLRRKKARQTRIIVLAIIGALLLHALLIPLLGWLVSHWPRKPLPPGNAPFHFSITPSDDAKKTDDALRQQPQTPYMRTTRDQASEEEIKNEDFISDQNTKAGSELPADASKPPLPTLQGREIPSYDFDTRPYRPGKEVSEAASAASQAAQQAAASVPNETPQPDRKTTARDSKTKTRPRSTAPTPTPVPDGELAMAKAQPSPADEPPHPEETPSDTPPPPVAKQSNNPQSQSSAVNSVSSIGQKKPPGYQPQTIQSKMSGSISNRGRPAVMAKMTPLGRYQKAVEDAIGSLWYMQVDQQMSSLLDADEVHVHFYITRSGQVRGARVSQGKAGGTLAGISYSSVVNAEIAPMPPEVAELLPGGELELDLGFDFYIR